MGSTPTERSVAVAGDQSSLTVLANGAVLRELVEHVALHQRISVESHAALTQRINVQLIDEPLDVVIRRLLRGYSYTLQLDNGTRDPSGMASAGKLWIYPTHPHAAELNQPADRFGVPSVDDRERAVQRMSSRSDAERMDAIAVLSAFGGEEQFAAMAAAVYDVDAAVRMEAVAGLGQSAETSAIALLKQALLDPQPAVRSSAARSLAAQVESGNTAALPLLGATLRDPDPRVRAESVDLLADIDGDAATRLLRQALSDDAAFVSEAAAEYLAER